MKKAAPPRPAPHRPRRQRFQQQAIVHVAEPRAAIVLLMVLPADTRAGEGRGTSHGAARTSASARQHSRVAGATTFASPPLAPPPRSSALGPRLDEGHLGALEYRRALLAERGHAFAEVLTRSPLAQRVSSARHAVILGPHRFDGAIGDRRRRKPRAWPAAPPRRVEGSVQNHPQASGPRPLRASSALVSSPSISMSSAIPADGGGAARAGSILGKLGTTPMAAPSPSAEARAGGEADVAGHAPTANPAPDAPAADGGDPTGWAASPCRSTRRRPSSRKRTNASPAPRGSRPR